jgi:hypothetical protein
MKMSGENVWRKRLEDIFCRFHSLFLFFTLFDSLATIASSKKRSAIARRVDLGESVIDSEKIYFTMNDVREPYFFDGQV